MLSCQGNSVLQIGHCVWCYATPDVCDCYVFVKKAFCREECHKVVLTLHSQGAIEGSMLLDWLLNEVPQDKLQDLKV